MTSRVVRPRTPHLPAIQWTGDNIEEMRRWLAIRSVALVHDNGDEIVIERRSGRQAVRKGEWLVSMDYDVVHFSPATFDVLFETVAD